MTRRSSLPLLVFLLLAPSLRGQHSKAKDDYALLYGTVFSPDGHTVPGVRILIRPANAHKPKYERFSDARGEFAQRLPSGPADYIVSADPKSPAFGKHSPFKPGKDVTVHFAANDRQDVAMHLEPR